MMMEWMMKLPDDMFRQEILQYLTLDNIVKLDNACMNHIYRSQLLDKMSGVTLLGDKDECIKASLFKWLGMRRIYLINMKFVASDFNLTPSSIENDYADQFRYTQHLILIGDYSFVPQVTDHTLKSIAEHCTNLQSLSLSCCSEITDIGLITISENCHFAVVENR